MNGNVEGSAGLALTRSSKRSRRIWRIVILCAAVWACYRILLGLITSQPGSREGILWANLAGALSGLILVILLLSPLYISARARVASLRKADPNPDAVILRITSFAQGTNEVLQSLGLEGFDKPQRVFVSLGVSRRGMTVVHRSGRVVAFFAAGTVRGIRVEEQPLASGPRYPVYSFLIETESGESLSLGFSIFNEATLGLIRVSEKRCQEMREAMAAALGLTVS